MTNTNWVTAHLSQNKMKHQYLLYTIITRYTVTHYFIPFLEMKMCIFNFERVWSVYILREFDHLGTMREHCYTALPIEWSLHSW